MRRFRLWIHTPYIGVPDQVEEIEVPEGADAEKWCTQHLEEMVWSYLDTGFEEIKEATGDGDSYGDD